MAVSSPVASRSTSSSPSAAWTSRSTRSTGPACAGERPGERADPPAAGGGLPARPRGRDRRALRLARALAGGAAGPARLDGRAVLGAGSAVRRRRASRRRDGPPDAGRARGRGGDPAAPRPGPADGLRGDRQRPWRRRMGLTLASRAQPARAPELRVPRAPPGPRPGALARAGGRLVRLVVLYPAPRGVAVQVLVPAGGGLFGEVTPRAPLSQPRTPFPAELPPKPPGFVLGWSGSRSHAASLAAAAPAVIE